MGAANSKNFLTSYGKELNISHTQNTTSKTFVALLCVSFRFVAFHFFMLRFVSLCRGVARRQIEEEVADFMGTEEAISYSDSATTISSAIPAFAKKGDLTIVDQVGTLCPFTTTTTCEWLP